MLIDPRTLSHYRDMIIYHSFLIHNRITDRHVSLETTTLGNRVYRGQIKKDSRTLLLQFLLIVLAR